MDINQIIELWRGLSPRLARAIPGKELPKDENTDEKKCDEDNEDKAVKSIENHPAESDIEKGDFKCLLIAVTLLGC